MKGLHLSPQLVLPADAITSTLIVYGGKGMGKTNLGTVFCEELSAAGQRYSVIDPMGVFWGLRHSADGKGPGIKVLILGGVHGDIQIEPTGGAVVADLVADEEVDTIIDISRRPDGRMWGVGERIRFVADYCARLYERQGERRRPLMQIIDEAGRFCPQEIRKDQPEIARCMGALERMVEEARNVGIGMTLITQRSARMNKSVSELADCMIAFRTVGPRSIAAILDWFGEHVEKSRWNALIESLRSLPRGSALVVSPGWLDFEGTVKIRIRRTFDSSATPVAGGERKAKGAGAQIDLDRYSSRMAETIERVKANDPRELLKRIAELERQLKTRSAAAVPPKADPEQERRRKAQEKAQADAYSELSFRYAHLRKMIEATAAAIGKSVEQIQTAIERNPAPLVAAAAVSTGPTHTSIAPRTERMVTEDLGSHQRELQLQRRTDAPKRAPSPPDNGAGVSGASQRVLDALAELAALGVNEAPRVQVAFMAGYTNLNSKGFTNAIGGLRSAGYIGYPSAGTINLTATGHAQASAAQAPRSSKELQDRLIQMLGGANGRIVRELVSVYPDALAREDLAAKAGYTNLNSKGFTNAIGRLRTLGFIDYPTPGQVAALPVLFLE